MRPEAHLKKHHPPLHDLQFLPLVEEVLNFSDQRVVVEQSPPDTAAVQADRKKQDVVEKKRALRSATVVLLVLGVVSLIIGASFNWWRKDDLVSSAGLGQCGC